jgi:hypothetical protein
MRVRAGVTPPHHAAAEFVKRYGSARAARGQAKRRADSASLEATRLYWLRVACHVDQIGTGGGGGR